MFLTAGSQAKVVMAMKPGGSGDLKDSKELLMWRYNKGAAYVPSPIADRRLPVSGERRRA